MLFWEALQCNKRFRSFIIDSNRSHDFVILCIFYAIAYKSDPAKQGVVRMCIFILQTMSVAPNFGQSLNMEFEAQDTLPQTIRIPNFRGSYADFLIIVSPPKVRNGQELTLAVRPHPDHHQQRHAHRCLSGAVGHCEQSRPLRRTHVSSGMLQDLAAVLVHVRA